MTDQAWCIAPDGRIVAQAKSFEEDLVIFDSNKMQGDMREQTPMGVPSAYAALVLGTRDYVRKCGFSKVVIGLSGGIDSALTAAIAVDALGKENVTGIAMPSQYSSEHSIKDARELACKLGIRFEVIAIAPIFDGYRKALAPIFAGTAEDVAEENIQSRIRGNILMAFSNKFGALVLTTGNKSEVGVGYCTLYGDMVGGLGVISDVPKTMVYSLSRYINSSSQSFRNPQSISLRRLNCVPARKTLIHCRPMKFWTTFWKITLRITAQPSRLRVNAAITNNWLMT